MMARGIPGACITLFSLVLVASAVVGCPVEPGNGNGGRPNQVTVPNVVGMTRAAAEAAVAERNLVVGAITTEYSAVEAGRITGQNPQGNTQTDAGRAVDLWVSKGPEATVPHVTNMSRQDAEAAISGAGLSVGTVTEQFSDTVPAGQVISQQPEGDTLAEPGSSVDMVVSRGRAVSVPGVVNMTEEEARVAIAAAELAVGNASHEYNDTAEAGKVMNQYPAGDTLVAEGSSVDLVVSKGPAPPTTVPNVVNMIQADAETAITDAELTVGTVRFEQSATVEADRVISQNPVSDTVVTVEAAVDLVISEGLPVLAASTDSVTLTGDSPSATVTVSNEGAGILRWTASRSDTRITVSPNSWSANSKEVTISTEDFSEDYTVSVTFTNDDDSSNTATVSVDVVGEGPLLEITPDEVTLTEASPTAVVTVSNIGGGTLRWTAALDNAQVMVSPDSATGNSVAVTISAQDFGQTRTIEVTFTNQDNALNAPTLRVRVLGDGPRLGVNYDEVNLTEATPSAKVVVSNIGEETLRWTASSEDETVKVSPSSATANTREVTISTSDFSQRKTVEVTFTNNDDDSDIKTVAVQVIPNPSELTVSTGTVRLASSARSGTVTVSNGGGGTLNWTAETEGAVIVTPASATSNSTDVTISAEAFTEPYTAYVTFVDADNAQNYEIVTVLVGPDQFTTTLAGNVDLHMRWIPAGAFMMGRYPGEQDSYANEDERREVTLSQGFWMGRYVVTKEQWEAVMNTRPWSGRSYVLDEPDTPAVYVSWADAQQFIGKLNDLTDLAFRLPTEAEWEYASRAGTTTRFYWGDDPDYTFISNYAWWWGNASNKNEWHAHPVGRKSPNTFGLYDMSGNVWEYCQDFYADKYPSGPVTDPTGPISGITRVIRGGSWGDDAKDCRSARRRKDNSLTTIRYYVGFRVSR